MRDQGVRNARQAWLATSSVEEEAEYLSRRLRAGELDPARLSLAARLGHPGACLACATAPLALRLPSLLKQVMREVPELDSEVGVRALLACEGHLFDVPSVSSEEGGIEQALLRGVEAWTSQPNASTRAEVGRSLQPLNERGWGFSPPAEWVGAGPTLKRAAQALLSRDPRDRRNLVSLGIREPLSGRDQSVLETLGTAVASELGEWLLGYGDPVARRSRARRAPGDAEA